MADQDQLANARLAYQEVCKSYQAIVDFRAKLLGFLPLASGAGAYVVLSKEPSPPWAWVAGLFGFVVTFGLFLYELRGLQRAAALEQAGRELEVDLGLASGQFREQPEPYLRGFVDPRGAAWVIYPTVEASWLYLIAVGRLGTFWAAVVAALLAVGIGWWMARRQSALRAQLPSAAGTAPAEAA
jgi:hypothetical protein